MFSPIDKLNGNWLTNCNIFIKREDLIPFSFGGNKARKAEYFFKDIKKNRSTCVVTYGSSSSNHCRIIANLCCKFNLRCVVITPINQDETLNTKICSLLNTEFISSELDKVSRTIENTISELEENGERVYFIEGGGHGNLGTQAYVDCYEEIMIFERENNIKFDQIVFASGTGTTQAGLVCGAIQNNRESNSIVGISIARNEERGIEVIRKSIDSYMNRSVKDELIFLDDYICEGYGTYNEKIKDTVKKVYQLEGIPLDFTYTGKAFYGMLEYYEKTSNIENILFIHTGGTPLFFDNLEELT